MDKGFGPRVFQKVEKKHKVADQMVGLDFTMTHRVEEPAERKPVVTAGFGTRLPGLPGLDQLQPRQAVPQNNI